MAVELDRPSPGSITEKREETSYSGCVHAPTIINETTTTVYSNPQRVHSGVNGVLGGVMSVNHLALNFSLYKQCTNESKYFNSHSRHMGCQLHNAQTNGLKLCCSALFR